MNVYMHNGEKALYMNTYLKDAYVARNTYMWIYVYGYIQKENLICIRYIYI